jgi:hypothetical protein
VDMGAGFWEISYTFGHKCRAEGNVIKLWTWVEGYGIFHIPVDMGAGLWVISYTCSHECRAMESFIELWAWYRAMGNVLELMAWVQGCGKFYSAVGKCRELWKEVANFMHVYFLYMYVYCVCVLA